MAAEEFPIMSDTSMLMADMGVTPTPPPAPAKAVKGASAAKERVRIVLEENDDIPPTGLFVGVNGTGYLLRPGEAISVPAGVLEVLDHAVMSMPQIDPQTQQVVGWRQRMRYPYRKA